MLSLYTRAVHALHRLADRGWHVLGDARLGLAIVAAAEADEGKGEVGSNNCGPWLDSIGAGKGRAWCAAAAWHWIDAGYAFCGWENPVPHTLGARRLFRRCLRAGTAVPKDQIRPGDVVCWSRGDPHGWKGHVAIVAEVRAGGAFVTWEGNSGHFPAKVRRRHHHVTERRLIGFARLGVPG